MDSSTEKTILILDDDKFLLDMYALKFTNSGFLVDPVLDSSIALSKLEDPNYGLSVLLMDIVMPKMDGFELLKQIKDKNLAQKTAVIVLSNLGEKDEIARATKLGADGYIIKANMTPSEVVLRVIEILKEKKFNL